MGVAKDARENEVISRLLTEWQKPLRLTTVAQGMAAVGLPPDNDLRWRIGRRLQRLWRMTLSDPEYFKRIRAALGLSEDSARLEQFVQQVQDWDPVSYILNEDEKLTARYILLTRERYKCLPSPEEVAQVLGQGAEQVAGHFEMLTRIRFLASAEGAPAGYRLGRRHRRFSTGLGFFFHTVTLSSGERFNVP